MNSPRARIFAVIASLVVGVVCGKNDAAAQRQTFQVDGHSYAGQTYGGNFHGPGKATLDDGTTLRGRWKNNRFIHGTVSRSDGVEYSFDGQLKYIFQHFDQAEIVGAGTAAFADGREYIGSFNKYAHFHGEGHMTLPDGHRQKGIWENGRFVRNKPDGWQPTTFETEGLDETRLSALNDEIRNAVHGNLDSLLVVKGGKLLIEEYYNRTNRYTLHDVQSVGKSFTSAMMGIAIDHGFIPGVDAKLMPYFPEFDRGDKWESQKDDITLEDLLTMSWGLANNTSARYYADFNNYGNDWVAEILDGEVLSRPGSFFAYSSAASRFCAPVIAKATGMSAEKFAAEYLFGPLGIDTFQYLFLPDGQPSLSGLDGIMARDLAKFGQLYLNKGLWNGQRILSEAWVQTSTSPHLKVTSPNLSLSYGYYFWIKDGWQIGARSLRTFFASGLGGNKIFVFPTEDLVVIITSSAFEDIDIHSKINRMMEDELLPVLIGSKLPQ
ncbi:serine hydrolase [Pelagibius sp. Alg239-R121]|uniref:serine hydrolase n=1 Tax=Pelagibius sp. Alg239-R121 TaxID=2993448 RepID=UPI0024A63F25|nr:serine hydrolase [Pelagibius sp. Alg239-R121]